VLNLYRIINAESRKVVSLRPSASSAAMQAVIQSFKSKSPMGVFYGEERVFVDWSQNGRVGNAGDLDGKSVFDFFKKDRSTKRFRVSHVKAL